MELEKDLAEGRTEVSDKILCPSCQTLKGREEKCPRCGCPGETERIERLETKNRDSNAKEKEMCRVFRIGHGRDKLPGT